MDTRLDTQLAAIVDELRLHRLAKRLTQVELATLAGMNRNTVADHELRRHKPNLNVLDALAGALGLQIGIYLEQNEGANENG